MKIAIGAALASLLASGVANATVYKFINQDIPPATATGTITTNGALGTLTSADITNVDITVADQSGSSVVIFPGMSFFDLAGSALTATAAGLFFNFSASDYSIFDLGFFGGPQPSGYCIAAYLACGEPNSNESIQVGTFYVASKSGVLQIASLGVSGVPEPASWTLMLLGFGGLGAALRSRKQVSAKA